MYPILQTVAVIAGGGGRHTYENTYENYQVFAYHLAAAKHVFYVAVGLIKISIALFVRRLADRTSRVWRVLADVFIASVVAYIVAAIFWTVYQCDPPRVGWDMHYGGTRSQRFRCGDSVLSTKVLSTVHVVQGGLLLLAPIVILWKVKMDLAKKLRLFFIWVAGGVTVTGGLLQHVVTVVVTDDLMYEYSGILVWASIELCLGILTASLPVLDAAIMGSWRVARSKLSSAGGRSQGLTEGSGVQLTRDSQTKSVIRSTPKKGYSESVENIVAKDGGMEMTIIRTDEVRLDYESLHERESAAGQFHAR